MKRVITKLTAVLLFSLVLAAGNQNAFAQGLGGVPLERDRAVLEGSVPYKEAVMRYLTKQKPKIVGGKPAPDAAFPWQVSLGVSWIADPFSAHFCGGSVLSERWIVTAAHCAVDLNPSQIVITAGTNRLVPGATRVNAKRIIVNKNYNAGTHDNDIALIELLDPLPISFRIKPVALITAGEDTTFLVADAPLVVVGWGATQEGGQPVRDLRFLDELPFVERSFCNTPLAYDGQITNNMLCAGPRTGGKDSCQGDSGGPLTIEIAAAPKLAGVVSWGEGCAQTNKVGVYTRVANYGDWIRACVSGSVTCNQ